MANSVHLLTSVLILVVIGFLSSPISGQEVELSYVATTSNHSEFPNPKGLLARADFPFNSEWALRVGLHRIGNETIRETQICHFYTPMVACKDEETHTSLSLTGVRVGLVRTLHSGAKFDIRGGGGLSFNAVRGNSKGISGLKANILIPNGGQIGVFSKVTLALTPFSGIPVRLVSHLGIHWVNFNACSGEDPPQYDPFCSAGTFRELGAGLSFPFR